MFLDYIEITNFRPYYGTQRINFGYNDDENLTVIIANNGSGKTSLVNALTWCLYGDELHDVRDKSEPLYNLRAAKEAEEIMDENEGKDSWDVAEILVKVKIRFYYYDGSKKKYFAITREEKYEKWGEVGWNSNLDSHLIVDETDKDTLEGKSATLAIESKIPEDMFQYFFFNGATLSNYFRNDSELNLKTSIEDISQMDLINDVSYHLNKTHEKLTTQFDKKNKGSDINYDSLISKKLNEKTDLLNEKEKNNNQIDIAQANIFKFTEKLENVDSEHAKELEKERKDLESQLKSVKKNIDSDRKEYESLILELFPITVLFDEIVNAKTLMDEAKEKKTAPPLVEDDLINDILEDGVCICGTHVDEHPECIEELKNRLKRNSKVKRDDFYDDYYEIKKVLSKLNKLPNIDKLKQNIDDNEVNKVFLENQIKEISEELINIDLEDVAEYEKQLQENRNALNRLRKRNDSITSQLNRLDGEVSSLKNKREQTEIVSEELKVLREKIKFAESAMDIVTDLRKNVQNHIRKKINDKTNQQFTNIDWGYNKYTNVNIGNDYKITIKKSSGDEISPGDLSDGEENLLALSFMMALHSLSGFEIPLIIDAPLEKLDKGKRIDFISGLHQFTADKQIVFLFTDSQYTPDVRAHMLKNIVEEYGLEPAENKTEIVKYGKR